MSAKPEELFAEAVRLVNDGFLVDAVARFRDVIAADPRDRFSDDAQYNIGLCYFRMNQFVAAEENFRKAVADYPDATIEDSPAGERGKTATKARLGILLCRLAAGDRDGARRALAEIEQDPDSYVLLGPERKRTTFAEIGREMIADYEEGGVIEVR